MKGILSSIFVAAKVFFRRIIYKLFLIGFILVVWWYFLLSFIFESSMNDEFKTYIGFSTFGLLFWFIIFNIGSYIIYLYDDIILALSKLTIGKHTIDDVKSQICVGDKFYFHERIEGIYYSPSYFSFKNFEKNLTFKTNEPYDYIYGRYPRIHFFIVAEIVKITNSKIIFRYRLYDNKVINYYVNQISKITQTNSHEFNIILNDDFDKINYTIKSNVTDIVKQWSFEYGLCTRNIFFNKSKIKDLLFDSIYPLDKTIIENRTVNNGFFPFNLEQELIIEINSAVSSVEKKIKLNATIIGLIILNKKLQITLSKKELPDNPNEYSVLIK